MFERYAVYYTFDGAPANKGAAWLGWDIGAGAMVAQPEFSGVDLARATQRPRKYGFHATIKAPFRLAEGATEPQLKTAFSELCAALPPAPSGTLQLAHIGRFLALTLKGDDTFVKDMAQQVVAGLDAFRAPLTDAEIARRTRSRLSDQQRQNLDKWGYPHVMDDYRFHITLTGPLKVDELSGTKKAAQDFFSNLLTQPFTIASLTLAGERSDGTFCEIMRLPLPFAQRMP
jgi:hypothetical protein